MYTDSGKLLLLTLTAGILTLLFEGITRKGWIPQWLGRKALHISAISLCAFAPMLIDDHRILVILVGTAEIVLLLLVSSGILFKEKDGRRSWGIVYFPLAYLVLLVLFSAQPTIIFFSMMILAWCDAMAATAGIVWSQKNGNGGTKEKTLAGNLSFVLTGILFYTICRWTDSPLPVFIPDSTATLLLFFVVLALAEDLGKNGIDNLFLPLLSAYLLTFPPGGMQSPSETALMIPSLIVFPFTIWAIRKGMLQREGAYAAGFLGLMVTWLAGWMALLPLCFFFLSSSLIGRIHKKRQRSGDLKAGKPRDQVQVWANGGVFLLCMVVYRFVPETDFLLLAAVSMAIATSDTWSSEIGTAIGGSTYDIRNGKKIPSGISGGISLAGTLGGLAGAFLSSSIALSVLGSVSGFHLLLVTIAGFAGMLADSVLGAVFQQKFKDEISGHWQDQAADAHAAKKGLSWMTNDTVNVVSNIFITSGTWCLLRLFF